MTVKFNGAKQRFKPPLNFRAVVNLGVKLRRIKPGPTVQLSDIKETEERKRETQMRADGVHCVRTTRTAGPVNKASQSFYRIFTLSDDEITWFCEQNLFPLLT